MSYEDIKKAVTPYTNGEESGGTETTEPTNPTPENSDNSDNPDNPDEPPKEPEEVDRENWTYKNIIDFYNRVRLALNAFSG